MFCADHQIYCKGIIYFNKDTCTKQQRVKSSYHILYADITILMSPSLVRLCLCNDALTAQYSDISGGERGSAESSPWRANAVKCGTVALCHTE